MSLPIEETIAELGNCDKPLLNSRLIELSNLNSEELELLEQAWAVIEPKRRRQIIYRLVELAELKKNDVDVQLAAIQALGKIGGSEAKRCLEQCLNNPSEVIRQAAEQALNQLEAEENPFTFR
ncbi:HEAT repeat domain-containing protein [Dehalococcoidales bacterium]|nr:HEAT repeat domain-containing protein [Dehalococcoidales bacterium]